MNRHLTDDEITAVLAGLPVEVEATRHLAGCVTCRREVERFRSVLESSRERLEAEAPDWDSQLESILARTDAAPARRRRFWRPLVAAAVAAAAAVAIVVIPHHRAQEPGIAVERVLAEVDSTLDSDPLEGLAPLEVLVPDAGDLERYADKTS